MHKKVVVLGGGTGISYLLRGLKDFPVDITAIITVSDNGSSTGKLRKEFNIPAVGDIRKVITSLSGIDDPIKKMMSYRFSTSSDLNGHAVGNLILTSMLEITGSLKDSINCLSKLLDVKHKVLPISEDSNLILMGVEEDGTIVEGEEQITKAHRKFERICYKEEPKVLPEVVDAIKDADLIIFSMGSLFTSILPNIICKQVKEAINASKAPLMYLCNAVTQPGETDNFTVSDHVKMLNSYLDRDIDVVIASNTKISKEMAKKYETEEQKEPVEIDYENIEKVGVELIEGDLLTIDDNTLKHDSLKLSSLIFSYLMRD
ncbi:MAG: uridine diphosphate-N-acetylglucosamine-binding protein YvcK [bacterium]|nr:uridine diphosphate-N-acetylglucosamine-binding protein YvcK [bacterium]